MRFRFCGDLDCPDWVLAEINTLSRMTSIKMKLLCQVVMTSLLGQQLDYDKAKKLTSDAKFDEGELHGAVAALGFTLRSAARHGVDSASLDSELQQLGLPRELALAVSRCHADNVATLSKHLAATSLRLSRLEAVEWRDDIITSGDVTLPVATVQLDYEDLTQTETQKQAKFSLNPYQLNTLISELKTAQSKMQEITTAE